MGEISVAMWNCSGLLSSSSAKEKIDFLLAATRKNCDILVLIETHHKTIQDIDVLHLFGAYNIIHTTATLDDPYAGILFFVSFYHYPPVL